MASEPISVFELTSDYIERARLSNLTRLPPEGKLAEELGVTRGRLRAALKQLEDEGVIWRHVGKGTFIGQRTLTGEFETLADSINPVEAFEARLVIEPRLAGFAAVRATPNEIADMRESSRRMGATHAYAEWSAQDQRLHRTIAKAARNTLLLALYDATRESTPPGTLARQEKIFRDGPRASVNGEHLELVSAIAERDADRAEQLMREHLIASRKALFGDR